MHQDWPVGPEFVSFRSKFTVTGVLIGPIWTWNGPFEDLLGPSGPCWLRRGSNWTHIIEMHQDWPVRPDFASFKVQIQGHRGPDRTNLDLKLPFWGPTQPRWPVLASPRWQLDTYHWNTSGLTSWTWVCLFQVQIQGHRGPDRTNLDLNWPFWVPTRPRWSLLAFWPFSDLLD